ncbi:uncharacterized protein LOC111354594 [Spodoptera litura]|uniref:Uncharacterized protein LOC111354594 n=1 Tax=Spodoptera litura TaxID=69820 RepID=A0A9J7E3Z8_SPOLT|nr:uncharacterized protein LOC111354594 [Spodoptera litura]
MKNAIEKVAAGEMGLYKASNQFLVPKTTLKRKLEKYKATQNIDIATNKKLGRFEQVFTKAQETELATYVKQMESRLFGLTTENLKKLAYDLAERNNISHNFDTCKKMAGRIWLENFLKRNPDLSLRKPEPTSAARAAGFNQVAVNNFFDLLSHAIETYHLTPDRIFNVDETGITTVPKSISRIIGTRGKKQIGLLTSAERGQLVTVVFCFGADGSYMPPLFIFPRKRMKPELMNNAPRGSWAECHESGWIQKDIFTSWFRKFIVFSRASKDNPVLLILDGHKSHTMNLDIIDLGRENGVQILATPPHCTHRLQPLDVAFMKPLSTYYSEAAQNWLRMNPGKVITQFQIAELVDRAFQKAATMTTAFNAFRATGIWPLNRDIFTEADFLAAATTDIELPNPSSNPYSSTDVSSAKDPQPSTSKAGQPSPPVLSTEDLQPLVSRDNQPSTSRANEAAYDFGNISASTTPSIEDIDSRVSSPSILNDSQIDNQPALPTTPTKNAGELTVSRPSLLNEGDTELSTSSTIMDNETSSVFHFGPKDIMPFPKTTKTKRANVKRGKTAIITSSPYRLEVEASQNKQAEKIKKALIFQKDMKPTKSEAKKSTGGWVQCPVCRLWAHCLCAGVEDEDEETVFMCEKCAN